MERIELLIDRDLEADFAPAIPEKNWTVRAVTVATIRKHVARAAGPEESPADPQLVVVNAAEAKKLVESEHGISHATALVAVTSGKRLPEWAAREEVADLIPNDAGKAARTLSLKRAALHLARRVELHRLAGESRLQERKLRELNRIGVSLSTERNLDSLLETIVTKAREITSADAGSLYLVERQSDEGEIDQMLFKVAQNDTLNLDFSAFRMPVNRKSISGYVALEGDILNLADVYELPDDVEYEFNRSFDEKTKYRSKSMLVVPMKNHMGKITGVLQLINKKRNFNTKLKDNKVVERQVLAFDEDDEELVSSLASQAAVSIENAQLYEAIQRQFESFIFASVSAIEQRDPTTAGHSERVATLTVGLAEAVDKHDSGKLKKVGFSREQVQEIFYAGLLHDFGKIGVREDVLVKAKKLYPFQLKHVHDRYRLIRKIMRLRVADEVLDAFRNDSPKAAKARLKEMETWLDAELARLEEYFSVIEQANEPAILPGDAREELQEMLDIVVEDPEGEELPLLTEDEYLNLSIPKGSLNEDERGEIESHVTHTYNFLKLIPWTEDLSQVAEIAYGHHEKLDGTGYPRGVRAKEIPVQTRMMTISDIFDALTATDRPYKKAVPLERALDILKMEVDEGKLDPELFSIFINAKVFEKVPAGQEGT